MSSRSIRRPFACISLLILLVSFLPTGSLPVAAQQPVAVSEQTFGDSSVLPAGKAGQPATDEPDEEIAAVLAFRRAGRLLAAITPVR